MILGLTDGTITIDSMGKFRSDVGESNRCCIIRKYAALLQGIHPQFPIVSTHYGYGLTNFLFRCRLQRNGADFACVEVYCFIRVGLSDRLQHRIEHFTRVWIGTACRGYAVYDQIHLTEFTANQFNGFVSCFVCECITCDAVRFEACFFSGFFECSGVVPACGGCTFFCGTARTVNTDRIRSRSKSGYNA
ncbi:hypothetical protein D3C74_328760 [compost metagenome]